MKHIIILISCVLSLSWQFTHAQCDENNIQEVYTAEDYTNEIERRFTDSNYSEWLLWDTDNNEGIFDSQKLNDQIVDGISDTANDDTPNYVILNDKDFYKSGSWAYVGSPLNGIQYIILTPGDYRDYSGFTPLNNPDITKYLLHYPGSINDNAQDIKNYYNNNPKTALEQAEHERAIIENFKLNEGNWIIKGITIRGNHNSRLDDENKIYVSGSSTSIINTNNNIVESCLFENQTKQSYLSITNGDNNIIHNCVIRDQSPYNITYLAGNDILGIRLGATWFPEEENAAKNNIIINNSIYNICDAIHMIRDTRRENSPYQPGDVIGDLPGTLIYNNEMYNEKEKRYLDQCGEERMNGEGAIDIKQGVGWAGEYNEIPPSPVSICKKVIIAKNEFYGWRRPGKDGLGRLFEGRMDQDGCEPLNFDTKDGDCLHDLSGQGGGSGEAISCHNNARNIAIIDNYVYDCTNGFIVAAGSPNSGSVGYIDIYNNRICNLYPTYDDSYLGNSYWHNHSFTSSYMDDLLGVCVETTDTPGHSLGRAIRVNVSSCIISDNIISGVLDGVYAWNSSISPTVTDNFFQNVALQSFNYNVDYTNFKDNTFVNSCYVYGYKVSYDDIFSAATENEDCYDENRPSSCREE